MEGKTRMTYEELFEENQKLGDKLVKTITDYAVGQMQWISEIRELTDKLAKETKQHAEIESIWLNEQHELRDSVRKCALQMAEVNDIAKRNEDMQMEKYDALHTKYIDIERWLMKPMHSIKSKDIYCPENVNAYIYANRMYVGSMKLFYENKIEHMEQTICSMKVREDQSDAIKKVIDYLEIEEKQLAQVI